MHGCAPPAQPLMMRPAAGDDEGTTSPLLTRPGKSRVRVMIVALLTAAPAVLMVLRAVPTVAVQGTHGIACAHDWSNTDTGHFLGSFFYGYISSQILGGWLSSQKRLGGRRMMLLCVGMSCILSLGTPLSVQRGGFALALAARVAEGFAQGPLFPTMWGLVGLWLPPQEISAGSCLVNSGFGIGTMLAFFVAPSVMGALGWQALFYLPCTLGAFWLIAWFVMGADSPDRATGISVSERLYIVGAAVDRRGVHQGLVVQAPPPTAAARNRGDAAAAAAEWSEMIRSPALWGQVAVDFAQNYFFYVVFTFLPQFISGALGFSTEHSAWLTGTNILVGIISTNAGGVFGDWAIKHHGRLLVRNVCVAVASLGPMACLLAICYLPSPHVGVILGLIVLVHLLAGINAAGSYCVVLDIFPSSAAAFTGLDNTIAQSTGIFAPIVTGMLLDAGGCASPSESGGCPSSSSDAARAVRIV
jgi:ACS family sodium-dependent inorganic phosphate cotransporter